MSKFYILMLMIALLCTVDVKAQETDTTYYDDYEVSDEVMYSLGLPAAEISTINKQVSFSMGGSMSLFVNKRWAIGLYGERLSNKLILPLLVDSIMYKDARLGYGHVGPVITYIIRPEKETSICLNLRGGWGMTYFSDIVSHINAKGDSYDNTKKVLKTQGFVLSPSVETWFTLSPNFKLSLSAGYRMNFGFENQSYSNSDFNSAFLTFSLLFGNYYTKDIVE